MSPPAQPLPRDLAVHNGSAAEAAIRQIAFMATLASGMDYRAAPRRAVPQPAPSANGFAASAWLLARGGGGSGGGGDAVAAPRPQYGGSQFGLLVRSPQIRPAGLSAFARATGALADRNREVAFGASIQPVANLPVSLSAERRLRDDGSSATGVGIVTGDSRSLGGVRIDSYGQAGSVFAARRIDYFDVAAVASIPVREAATRRGPRLSAGAGVWAGGQTGSARLDVGPRLETRPGRGLRLSLDYRFRLLGNARPGSGPALTLGSDF